MMAPLPPADKQIVVIDSQRLKMIQNCAYKYNNVFNLNLVPVEKAFPLERGSIIHVMLQAYYLLRQAPGKFEYTQDYAKAFPDSKMPKLDTLIDVIKLCIAQAENAAIPMQISIEDVDDAIRVFREYVEFYQHEPHQTLAVEQVASRILHEDDELVIIYETKIDWATRLPNVPLLPWDHKTYGRKAPVNPLDDQFMGYCWMLNVNNIGINRIGFQTSVAPKDKFLRPILSYPTAVLEGWRTNAIWWIKQLQRHTINNVWPQNFTSCGDWSGCIFQDLCLTQPDMRNWKARTLFQIGEDWDPGADL